MQPHARRALEGWHTAWTAQQDAALVAFAAAFPGLGRMEPPTGCCDPRMKVERPGEASGFVCFDDHGRATVDFSGIPQNTLGETLEVIFGRGWFDEGPDGIGAAPPGTYNWDDDATYAEFEIKVEADATASICMSYVTVDEAVVLLDELQTHLVGRTGGPEES
ncbi:hypothetical protein AB0D34_12460 [Streptomyces sp. NPDC048420]|uniref:hypothetical protein n=1 Tax=Streptomyces sp. NPDC048420 TaxID=3155755 RepID=UPI003412AC1F